MFSFSLMITLLIISGCGGGGGDTSPSSDDTEWKDLVASYPENSEFSDTNKALAKSLQKTQGALLQAILLTNSYIYTDPSVTTYTTFEQRRQRAIEAFQILNDNIGTTLADSEAYNSASQYFASSSEIVNTSDLISPKPWGGKRPIKALMEKYGVSSQRAMTILIGMADEITADAYIKGGNDLLVAQKQLELQIEGLKIVGAAAGGIVLIQAGAAVGTGGAMLGSALGSIVLLTGQNVKLGLAADALMAAEKGKEAPPTPTVFVPFTLLAEAVSVVTLSGIGDVVLYGTEKMQDLIKSGGKVISFGAYEINVYELTQAALDTSRDIDVNKWPTTEPGVYLTPDGETIVVTALPVGYNKVIGDLEPSERLIVLPDIVPPIATPLETDFTDSVEVTLISPDNLSIVYRINGGDSLLYTGPITLTETSTIVAYADRDPYDLNAEYSDISTFQYTKVGNNTGIGRWVLYDTTLIDGCSFYQSDCYPLESCTASQGSYQVAIGYSTCGCDTCGGDNGSGTYTVPPATLTPGETITFSVTAEGDGYTTEAVCFYGTSVGLTFDDHGSASFQPDWCEDLARSSGSVPPSAEYTVPDGLGTDGVLKIVGGGSIGSFETSMSYYYLYRWQE